MDGLVGAQFLAAITQISVTVFAVYMAMIIYVLGDKKLAKILFNDKRFMVTFILAITGFLVITITPLFMMIPSGQLSNNSALALLIALGAAFLVLLINLNILISIRKKA